MLKSNGKKGGPAPRRRGLIRSFIAPPTTGHEAAERAKLTLALHCVAFVNGRRFYAPDISRAPGNGRNHD